LFIDDRTVNTDAARAVGMHAIQFTGDVAVLRSSLSDFGLIRA
jgi:hypothetical protein